MCVLEPVLSLGGVWEFQGGLLCDLVDLDAEVGGEGEEERVQVAGRAHQIVQGVAVVLTRIGQKHGRPEVLGLRTCPENQVHVVHHCHLDLVVHVLGEETGLLQQFTLLHLVLLLGLLVQLVLTPDSVGLGVVKISITGIVVSIIPLFLKLLSLLLVLLKPALVLEYHPGHLLIEYVLAGPREHLRDAQVAHMRHHRQRRHHPQVTHVNALAVEGQLEALAVHRHYQQTVQHAHQVRDHRRTQVTRRLVQIDLVIFIVFAFGVLGNVVAQVFSCVGF